MNTSVSFPAFALLPHTHTPLAEVQTADTAASVAVVDVQHAVAQDVDVAGTARHSIVVGDVSAQLHHRHAHITACQPLLHVLGGRTPRAKLRLEPPQRVLLSVEDFSGVEVVVANSEHVAVALQQHLQRRQHDSKASR